MAHQEFLTSGACNGPRIRGARRRRLHRVRRLRNPPEGGVSMIVALLYGAAAIGVGVYMLWALIKPEQF